MTTLRPLISANVRSTARRSAPWKSRLIGCPVYCLPGRPGWSMVVVAGGGVGGCGVCATAGPRPATTGVAVVTEVVAARGAAGAAVAGAVVGAVVGAGAGTDAADGPPSRPS